MTRHRHRLAHPFTALVALALAGAGCAAPVAPDDDAAAAAQGLTDARCPPPVPPGLAVPEGHKLAFAYAAAGEQLYRCQLNGDAYGWSFKAPDADLFKLPNGNVAGSHYAGPTWEALDGSTVVGARVAGASVPGAVPWLLLSAVSHGGPDGRMSKVSFIQRLDTTDGLAPTTACDAAHAGVIEGVDYTATYYFFVPNGGNATGQVCAP